VPVEIDLGSEFRYRPAGGLALFISQSSETADTLAASRYLRGQKRGWTAGSITACRSRLVIPSSHRFSTPSRSPNVTWLNALSGLHSRK